MKSGLEVRFWWNMKSCSSTRPALLIIIRHRGSHHYPYAMTRRTFITFQKI